MDRLLLAALARLVEKGDLRVTLPDGAQHRFGDGSGAPVAIRFADRMAVFWFLVDPELRLGELYMDGRLILEAGTIYDFLFLILSGARGQRPTWLERLMDGARFHVRRLVTRNTQVSAKANVSHHYDLDDKLYALFLDEDWQYSCAYFETPEQSLEEAQRAKKRHIAAKLCVGPAHRVLDIGCGWGGLGLYLGDVAGAREVLGITLSKEQLAVANQRALERGMAEKVRFELQDYRDLKGSFDRIVSVGMFEHVGPSQYETFFEASARLLDENGVMLLHTIGCSDGPNHPNPWLNRYIFPGGYLPSLSEMLPVIERAGLIVTDIEILRLHYAYTLKAWRERFDARRAEAAALYDERFCKMWEFYLAMSQTAFECQDVAVFQLQLARRQEAVPLTRDYIQDGKARLIEAERRNG